MTTIAQVIDRTYRDYLTPPGEQPARFQVGSGGIDANAATTALPVKVTMLSAEEQDAIGVGRLIEGETGELFLIEGVTGDPPTDLTVRREMYDTTAAALTEDQYLYLAGDDHQSRKAVFDAVADAITNLWPDLYVIDAWETVVYDGPTEIPEEAATVVDVEYRTGSRWLPAHAWRVLGGGSTKFPHTSSGRAIQMETRLVGSSAIVYYRKAATRPTAESDELTDLYIDDAWTKVIIVGAVAQLIANKDLDRATLDYITESLEAQGFQVGQGSDIRNSLLQFQDFLKRPLRDRLALQEDDRVVHTTGY